MKKLVSLIAVMIALTLMFSMTIVPVSAESEFSIAAPEGYKLVETLITDESGKLANPRILESYNWNYLQNSLVAYMDNADGCQRIEANGYQKEAYLVLSVNDSTVLKVGTVISNSHADTAYNKYYASKDGSVWTQVGVAAYNVDTYSVLNGAEGYFGRVETVEQLPEGTTQLRIVTGNTADFAWWNPFLDFINVYTEDVAVEYDTALDGYGTAPVKTYFDQFAQAKELEQMYAYSNVSVAGAGLGKRDSNYMKPEAVTDAYVVLEADKDTALEVGEKISIGKKATTGMKFYVSSDAQNWAELTDANVAFVESEIDANYFYRQYRVVELPSSTKYIKAEIVTADTWQPGVDYIDVYKKTEEIAAISYDTALDGYGNTAVKTYFDQSAASAELDQMYAYSNVSVASAGLGKRDSNYMKPEATTDAYVVLEVNCLNALEVGEKISIGKKATTGMKFYASSDAQNWAELTDANVASVESDIDANYFYKQYRVANLPLDTMYVKAEIVTADTWQPGVDYIDVYQMDEQNSARYDSTRFESALKCYSKTASKTYLESTELDVIASENVGVAAGGLHYRGINYVKLTANGTGYVVVEIDADNVVEVANVFAAASGEVKYYVSSDAQSWSKLSIASIATSKKTAKADGTALYNENTYALIDRLFNLPDDAEYLKVEINGASWQPAVNYIDIFEKGHSYGEFAYNEFTCMDQTECEDCGTVLLCGDVNSDGTINILDFIRLKKHLAEVENIIINAFAADANADDNVDVNDLAWMRTTLLTKRHYYYF